MEKIRVLQCIETISSGGVEQTRLTLAKYLPTNRFEIKIICTYAGGPIADNLRNEGVELIVVSSMKHPLDWTIHKQVQGVISSYRPHIIHGAVFEGNSMAAISGFLKRVPVIILEETSDPQNRSSKADWLLRQLMKVSDVIIAISPDVKNYLKKKAKITPSKIKMIFNGVPIPEQINHNLVQLKKEELKISEDEIVIGFVGRLFDDHKKLTDLIDAISIINDPIVKLLVVGDGRDKSIIVDLIRKLELNKQVILVGFQENTGLFYSVMDILCVPSAREGFGLVAVEAMLHKLPVIATAVGGLKDIVIDGKTGYLVKPKSHKDLADKINELVHDSQLRVTFGEAGYVRAKEKFTADRYCLEVENLYIALLKKKGFLH